MSTCPVGTYSNSTSKECKKCHKSCKECTGPGASECKTCNTNFLLFNKKCVESCDQGTYKDISKKECLACPTNCKSCESNTKCLSCLSSFKMKSGKCVSEIKKCSPAASASSNIT